MKKNPTVLLLWAAGALLPVAAASAAAADRAVLTTRYELIIGSPVEPAGPSSGTALTPGEVVFAQDEATTRDLSGLKDRLRQTYGLVSAYTTAVAVKELAVGEAEVMPTAPSELGVTVTLVGLDAGTAAYLVRLEAEGQLLAHPKIVVKRGGRAIVASRDGARAPYAFIVIEAEPELPAPKATDGIIEPRLVEKVSPLYPEEARKARVTGAVILELAIDTAGRVTDVTVLQAQPAGLTEAAVDAVRRWRYEPARTARGVATPVALSVTITFRLQ